MRPGHIGLDSRGETEDTLLQLEGPSAAMINCEHGYLLPPAVNADHMLTVRRGDLDLEYVDVWRIERGGG